MIGNMQEIVFLSMKAQRPIARVCLCGLPEPWKRDKLWIGFGFGLRQQFETECQYWTKVLKRVVAVVKFLSEHGIAFRGGSNTFGSPVDGNYLWCLELISQFYPFLRESIAHFGNAPKRTKSYLSTTICDVCSLEGGDKFCQKAQITFKQTNIFPLV